MTYWIDPIPSYSFLVTTLEKNVIGYFSEVSGLSSEIEFEEYSEGGLNEFVHRLPKKTKYNNLVLKWGITVSSELYDWYKEVTIGEITAENIRIELVEPEIVDKENVTRSKYKMIREWTFKDAYPIKWNGPDLNATSNNIAIESVEFVHNGLVY